MVTGFNNWLAGLIDGEGSFTINKAGEPKFQLGLRDDDSEVIREIVEKTGIGRMEHRPYRNGSNPSMVWMVVSREALGALVELLDEHPLRTKKARDYLVWREAVMVFLSYRRRGRGQGKGIEPRPDIPELLMLRDRLMEGRRYVSGLGV